MLPDRELPQNLTLRLALDGHALLPGESTGGQAGAGRATIVSGNASAQPLSAAERVIAAVERPPGAQAVEAPCPCIALHPFAAAASCGSFDFSTTKSLRGRMAAPPPHALVHPTAAAGQSTSRRSPLGATGIDPTAGGRAAKQERDAHLPHRFDDILPRAHPRSLSSSAPYLLPALSSSNCPWSSSRPMWGGALMSRWHAWIPARVTAACSVAGLIHISACPAPLVCVSGLSGTRRAVASV